jgi:hypothetical protein
MTEKREFKPGDFTIDLNGKEYLPVAARVKWFRTIHPNGSIETTEVTVDLDRPFPKGNGKVYGYARFHATVRDADGHLLGQGTKTETAANFFDFVEKAETGAIGRALAASGFGTELDQDLDEGRIVDSPQGGRRGSNRGAKSTRSSERPTAPLFIPEMKPMAAGELRKTPDIIEWLEIQARRAGFENLQAACKELDYPYESVLTIEAMQRSLDKELKGRITTKSA